MLISLDPRFYHEVAVRQCHHILLEWLVGVLSDCAVYTCVGMIGSQHQVFTHLHHYNVTGMLQ